MKGENVFTEPEENFLRFEMNRPENGGLRLEAAHAWLDYGGPALVPEGGKQYLAGVFSDFYVYYRDEEDTRFFVHDWESRFGRYSYTGGEALQWIRDNLADLENSQPATELCAAYGP